MMVRVSAVIVGVVLGGCSAASVRGPSSARLECTHGNAAPIADTVIAPVMAATFAATAIHASRCRSEHNDSELIFLCDVPVVVIGVPAVVAALAYGVSALHGYSRVSECRTFKRSYQLAADAARSGDCASVRRLAAEARPLGEVLLDDPDLHGVVEHCLAVAPKRTPPGPIAPDVKLRVTLPGPPRSTTEQQSRTSEEPAAPTREQEASDRRRMVATDMTTTAKYAARNGDCATVKSIEPRVLAVDPEFHRTVFVTDLAIKACLNAPSPPAPAGSPPTPASDARAAPPVAPDRATP